MSKCWKVGTPDDALSFYVVAPNRGVAIKLVEQLTGPINPSRVIAIELSKPPAGYKLPLESQGLLEEDPDYEG